MTNKELEAKIKEIEKLVKFHDKQIDGLLEAVGYINDILPAKSKPEHHDFKVGDRVQFEKYNGEIVVGTIRDICMDKATIEQKTEDGVGVYIMGEVHLGCLKPTTDEPKCKFKVGDKVIAKTEIYEELNNKIATITDIREDNCLIQFDEKELGSVWATEVCLEPYTEPRWTFTDDEKVILRNLPSGFNWIGRDEDDSLNIFNVKPPQKSDKFWDCGYCSQQSLEALDHLFQSIKWTDTEPCEFRKYL